MLRRMAIHHDIFIIILLTTCINISLNINIHIYIYINGVVMNMAIFCYLHHEKTDVRRWQKDINAKHKDVMPASDWGEHATFPPVITWRIIPVSIWLITMVSNSPK